VLGRWCALHVAKAFSQNCSKLLPENDHAVAEPKAQRHPDQRAHRTIHERHGVFPSPLSIVDLAAYMQQTPLRVLVEVTTLGLRNSKVAISACKPLLSLELVRNLITGELLKAKSSPITTVTCTVKSLQPGGQREPEMIERTIDPDEHRDTLL